MLLVLLVLLQQPMAMAKEFDLVSSWNSYITNSNILRVREDVMFDVTWQAKTRNCLLSSAA
jgi:hypothetical protein